MKTFVDTFSLHWTWIQRKYDESVRWADYRRENPNLPRQTNLHHILSVERLCNVVCGLLYADGHQKIDFPLIVLAVHLHEDGEMFEGDTLYHEKTNESHEAELDAFLRFVLPEIPTELHDLWRRAFLLQYVYNTDISFKDKVCKDTLENLRNTHKLEARIFDFVERLDYLLYATEAGVDCDDTVLYTHVLRNQLPHFKRHLAEFPWFQKLLPESSLVEHEKFLKLHADIPGPDDEGGIPAAYAYARTQGVL